MNITPEELSTLLRLIGVTEEREIDCDEFLSLVAGYLERRGGNQEPPNDYAGLHQHLQVCPECQQELAALVKGLGLEDPKTL